MTNEAGRSESYGSERPNLIQPPEAKNFDEPDEVRTFPRGRIEVVRAGGHTLGRVTYEPGFRWSECIGSRSGSRWCYVEHVGFILSGTFSLEFEDGTTVTAGAGTLVRITPGHDGWVESDEPCVILEVASADRIGK